jgi:hypothetical protein
MSDKSSDELSNLVGHHLRKETVGEVVFDQKKGSLQYWRKHTTHNYLLIMNILTEERWNDRRLEKTP